MSFFTPAPMHGPIHNTFGVQVGSVVDGRVLDRFGFDSGLRVQPDWNVLDRNGFNSGLCIDPCTGRFIGR